MARRVTKPKPKSKTKRKQKASKFDPRWVFASLTLLLVASAVLVLLHLPVATGRGIYTGSPLKLQRDYAALQQEVEAFEYLQTRTDGSIVSDQTLQSNLSRIQLLAAGGNYIGAETAIHTLSRQLKSWRDILTGNQPGQLSATSGSDKFIPILIYHYTPDDLDSQLTYLEQNGYSVVGLDVVAAAMNGGAALPDKPVVLTFDDGFANQMSAFEILQRHHMKATFYIINGGDASNWCIGAGRQYGLPSQPASGCGDAYLTWDQVRTLDSSGLITIGGHTLDHPELTTLDIDTERHEIADSKAGIEAQIGHPIYDFAYPYGNYNQTTIDLVREAGYRSAVTTLPGDYQPPGSIYTLRRIRTTIGLP